MPGHDSYDEQYPSAKAAADAVRERLRGMKNVFGVGIGPKIIDGERTDRLAIVIHVNRKEPPEELPPDDFVPPTISLDGGESIPTDVQEDEIPTLDDSATAPREVTHRPVFGGIQITTDDTANGTIATAVEQDGETRLLANRHVVSGGESDPVGVNVEQPGDGNGEVIGEVTEASSYDTDGTNTSDSALIDPSEDTENHIASVGQLGSAESASYGETYLLSGVASGVRAATVTELDYSGSVDINGESLDFEGITVLENVTDGGDSGSVWGRYDEDDETINPIGIHFAGGSLGSLAIPWSSLEDEHGDLTPADGDADVEPTVTTDRVEVVPIRLSTGVRATLECLGTRYGDPDDLPDGSVDLVESGGSGTFASAEVTSDWGEPQRISFAGLEDDPGVGEHDVDIVPESGTDVTTTIEILDPDEHRLHGTVTDTDGDPIEGVDVAAWQEVD